MGEQRTADEIQHDIEQARASLAVAVDQLTARTSPKRLAGSAKQAVLAKLRSPQGQAVLGGVGIVVAIVVIRKVAKR